MKKIVLLILIIIILTPLTLFSQPRLTELQKIAIKASTIYPCLSSEQKIAIIKLENCNDYYQTYYDSIRPKLHEENQELRRALIINDSVKTITKEVALNNAALLKQESKENKDLKIENTSLSKENEKLKKKKARRGKAALVATAIAIAEGVLIALLIL